MEKEMKKLLLVAVSVGVFLLVTITVAIIVLTPKAQTQDTAFSASVPRFQRTVQPASEIMSNIPVQPEITPNINIENETSDTAVAADSNDGNSLTIQIPRPSTAAVPENTAPPPPPVIRAPSTTAAAPAPRPASQPAAPRPTTRPAAPAPSRTINDYWVQIGAYSAIVYAEDAKERLASKGLTSIIETRIRASDGRQLYHVRLGPYTSEREANYWLTLVQSIDDFSQSELRRTARQQ